ncbi:hypothetical protein GmHk_18G051218 [Glycine max]|nr:hypothetical protein GmHk_18G051218 [Glycine max]
MFLTWMTQLKRSSNSMKKQLLMPKKFGRPSAEIKGLVVVTGLSHLVTCSLDTDDRVLILAFAERWHKETSSFHLPVGDVTLDDMAFLLHLPITGAFYIFETLHVDEVVLMLVELLKVSGHEARTEAEQCHGAYSGHYAWGVATLVHMYNNLNDASKSSSRQLAKYITLLQCWIYDHFSSLAEAFTDEDYDERSPHAYRCLTVIIVQLETLTGFLVFIDISDGVSLLSHTDQRGLCDSLGIHPDIHLSCNMTHVEPNMSQYLMEAAAMEEAHAHAPSDVEQPRHAVETCQAITGRLERLLNLRIVTKGTKTNGVMQDSLRIARGVTMDCYVYVRT